MELFSYSVFFRDLGVCNLWYEELYQYPIGTRAPSFLGPFVALLLHIVSHSTNVLSTFVKSTPFVDTGNAP